MRRAVLEILEERIIHNVKEIHRFSGKRIIAVVKANAYGIGVREVSTILEGLEEVDAFAVACTQEGVELRECGIKKKILILGGILEEDVKLLEEYDLTPVISDPEHLKVLKDRNIKFHVKYDTGMGRLGFTNEIIKDPRVEGVMSHFSSPADRNFSKLQIKRFEEILKNYEKVKYIHLESSAGLIYRVPFTTHVRVGLAIYGEKPLKDYPLEVKPALRLRARLISVKELPENYPVSYGRTYITKRKTKLGVVAFGYADGLMKTLSNRSFLIFEGRKVPIIGNITMDMTMVDLSGTEARTGDWVYIVNEERSFTPLARDAGTIPYEIMCNLSRRVERLVIKKR
ncbi:alanine racemase [Aquifex pyrophilus]